MDKIKVDEIELSKYEEGFILCLLMGNKKFGFSIPDKIAELILKNNSN